MRRNFRFQLAALTFLFASFPSRAATLYVSPTGDGTNGLTWETAFTTVGEAIASATSGAAEIWIRGGTYAETVSLKSNPPAVGK